MLTTPIHRRFDGEMYRQHDLVLGLTSQPAVAASADSEIDLSTETRQSNQACDSVDERGGSSCSKQDDHTGAVLIGRRMPPLD